MSPARSTDLPLLAVDRSHASVAASAPPRSQLGRRRLRPVLRRVRWLPLIPLLLATGGVVGLYFQPPGVRVVMRTLGLQPGGGTANPFAVPAPATAPAKADTASAVSPSPAAQTVIGLGKLLPLGEVVTVAPPFGAGDARIAAIPVREGERIERGALLASLDNERQLQAAVEAARSTVAAREAILAQTEASVRASRAEATAALARAEATARNAGREFERTEALRGRGFTTDSAFDQRRAARDETLREVERARATLSRFGGDDIAAQPDVLVAARNLDAAKADLATREAELDKASVRAPIAGTVLTIHARPGERPGAEGILNLGNIDEMTVEIEVYQTMIGRVALGDAVTISADALPAALTGAVTRIGLEVQRQSLIDPSPAANTDARVVKVTAELDSASTAVAARFTNLQVLARITRRSAP